MKYAYYNDGLEYYVLGDDDNAELNHIVFDAIATEEQLILSFPNYLTKKEEAQIVANTVLRSEAYKNESDPIFFQWQRGEKTEQEWLDKVEEIKQRYS